MNTKKALILITILLLTLIAIPTITLAQPPPPPSMPTQSPIGSGAGFILLAMLTGMGIRFIRSRIG